MIGVDNILASDLHDIAEHHVEVNLDILNSMIQEHAASEKLLLQMKIYIAWYQLFVDTQDE